MVSYTDQTGRLSYQWYRGNQYISLLYDSNSNYILVITIMDGKGKKYHKYE